MKKIILSISIMLAYNLADAQATKQPADGGLATPTQQTQTQKVQLPDLTVPEIQLVSAVRDESKKAFIIKVKAAIKNKGIAASTPSKINGFVQKGNGVQLLKVGDPISIPGIKQGATFNSEFTFSVPFEIQRENQFKFLIRIDDTHLVKEADESNNSSVGILIGL